jgi:hypothetical protein
LYDVISLEENTECELGIAEVDAANKAAIPLEELPVTPTRSLGGFFDYSNWPDCERFLDLDAALSRLLRKQAAGCRTGSNEAVGLTRRCTARRAGGFRCEKVFKHTPEYAGARCPEHRHRLYIHPSEALARSAA